MRRDDGEQVKFQTTIALYGNWNYKRPELRKATGKPLGVITIGEHTYVMTHEEIFKLIKPYLEVDMLSVRMINNPEINTGWVTEPEQSFTDKLKQFLKKEWEIKDRIEQ